MKKNPKKRIHLAFMFGILSVLALYFVFVFSFAIFSGDKIYPGVRVAQIDLGGKTASEAKEILAEKTSEYLTMNTDFNSKNVSLTQFDINFEIEKSVSEAREWGQKNPFWLGRRKDFPLLFSFDEKDLNKFLLAEGAALESPVLASSVSYEARDLVYVSGRAGKRVNYAKTAANFLETVGSLGDRVEISLFEIDPGFEEADFIFQKKEILDRVGDALTLEASGFSKEVEKLEIFSWISFGSSEPSFAKRFWDDEVIGALFGPENRDSAFSAEAIYNYLAGISGQIDRAPKNVRVTEEGGRAIVLEPSFSGKKLSLSESAASVIRALEAKNSKVALSVESVRPEINEDNLLDLGISELVSVGYSSFLGSPANRVHNIRVGARSFDGVLAAPGENVSFNKILGPVEAETGYLPELVILDNKTVPQFGGGLCQVSSTAFRAALNAGFPILERTAHAYPVQYYKPFGVDASIYLPKPDLVFKNDTGAHLLIQTRIVGQRLFFDFYGTKPQRKVLFAGNEGGSGAVGEVELVTPYIYEQEARGKGSFSAIFWRFNYDETGKFLGGSRFVSKYDSPDKYPR